MKISRPQLITLLVFFLIVFFLYWLIFHSTSKEEYCWQCGANRVTGWLFRYTIRSPSADRVEKILGHKCAHEHWALDNERIGLEIGDNFAHRRVPLICYGPGTDDLLDHIESLPRAEWRQQALLAVGDPANRLKWVATLALKIKDRDFVMAFDLPRPRPHLSEAQWDHWWRDNQSYFEIVYDRQTARDRFDELSRKHIDLDETIKQKIEFYFSPGFKTDLELY